MLSEADSADDLFKNIGAVVEALKLLIGQVRKHASLNAAGADEGGNAQADVFNAVFAVQHRGNRHYRVYTAGQAFDNVAHGDGNGIIGCAFSGNDFAAGGADIFFHFIIVELGKLNDAEIEVLSVFGKGGIADLREGPRHEHAVAVLAQHIGVDIFLGNVHELRKAGAKARGVQKRAGSDDAVFRNIGDFMESIGHDINGIGDDDVKRVGRMLGDFRGDVFDQHWSA